LPEDHRSQWPNAVAAGLGCDRDLFALAFCDTDCLKSKRHAGRSLQARQAL
jgi:hypothetical protein